MDAIENGNYVYENGWYKSIFRVYIPYGRGFDLNTSQIKAITHVQQLEGCSIRFTKKSKNISHKQLMSYVKNSDKKAKAGENLEEAGDRNSYRENIKNGFPKHFGEYGDTKSELYSTGIHFKILYTVKAKSLEKLKEQIDFTKEHYKKGTYNDFTQYIELIPLLTEEYTTIEEIFTSDLIITDKDSDTSLQTHYSGIDFFESGIIQDELGTPIGYDIYSAISSSSGAERPSRVLFDFNRYVTDKALVAIPYDMSLRHYKYKNKKRNNIVPTASIIGQTIANQIVLNAHIPVTNREGQGLHKVAHVVLNNYSYENVAGTQIYDDTKRLFNVIDMNNVSINPLQPTGDIEEQDKLYTSTAKKISTLINVASNFNLEKADINILEKAVEEVLSKRWGDNDEDKKIVGQDPMIFPEIAEVGNNINTQKEKYIAETLNGRAESIDNLYTTLERIIGVRKKLIGNRTSFKVPFSYQNYFDFSNIADDNLKIVQFINSINTIITSLNDGDCLIIHGVDRIPPKAITDYLKYEIIERTKNRGIRLVYLMDSFITGQGYKITDYQDILYTNYDKDFDCLIQGYVPIDKFYKLEELYMKKFNDTVKRDLTYSMVEARTLLRCSERLATSIVDIGEVVV